MSNNTEKNPYLTMGRLEAFTDGVFAIAITLLVMEIKVPGHARIEEAGSLYNALIQLWPHYLSYIVSFFVIGVWWSSMHHFHQIVKRTNHAFNLINIFFFMTIAFIPFTTAVMGEYISEPEHRQAAVTVYCLGYYLPSVAALIMVLYAFPNYRLADPAITKKFLNTFRLKVIAGQVLTLAALVVSFFFPLAALVITGLAFVMFFIPPESPEYN